jgi:hypothetical protein
MIKFHTMSIMPDYNVASLIVIEIFLHLRITYKTRYHIYSIVRDCPFFFLINQYIYIYIYIYLEMHLLTVHFNIIIYRFSPII